MRFSRLGLSGCVMLLALAVGGCGFTPMYGSSGVANGLSDIRVRTGDERVDFYLQEALLDAMDARHAAGPLLLVTDTDVRLGNLGVGADATFSRRRIDLQVNYRLYDGTAEAPVASGSVTGEAAYDSSPSIHADLTAERDAEERAARMAAQRITVRLARALEDAQTW